MVTPAPQIVKLSALTPDARAVLFETLGGYDEQFAAEIDAGISEVYRVDDGYMITRLEKYVNAPPELVVCCLANIPIRFIGPVILEGAKHAGCGSIRFHTTKPGVARLARCFGATLTESIYTVKL